MPLRSCLEKKSWSVRCLFSSLGSLRLRAKRRGPTARLPKVPAVNLPAVVDVPIVAVVAAVALAPPYVPYLTIVHFVNLRLTNCKEENVPIENEDVAADVAPAEAIQDVNNNPATTEETGGKKARQPRERRERGPPADGVPSKTKVMVANLPYDLNEDAVCSTFFFSILVSAAA